MAIAHRDDVKGDPKAPVHIVLYLLRVGHKNPFGEPNYRLVHSTTRFTKEGGEWKIWAENLSIQERGGMKMTDAGLLVPHTTKPERIEVCVKPVKKYHFDFEGWLLERWVPSSYYGPQSDWEALHVKGFPQVPMLGPYPAEGDYEPCTHPLPELPSMEKLHEAILFQDRCDERVLRDDVEQRIKDRIYEKLAREEKEQQDAIDENEYRIKEFLTPWKSTSLEAGRWRSEHAKRAGVKEHAGN